MSDDRPLARHSDGSRDTSLTLLARLRAGEPDSWRTMIELYQPLAYFWVRRHGLHGADADDLVQELFAVAARSLPQFRKSGEHDSFRAWLRGIARNLVLQHLDRSQRQPNAAGGTDAFLRFQSLADAAPAPDEDDPPAELSAFYARALELVRSEIEENTWRAFWLTAVEGRTPDELTQILQMTPAAIRKAKSRTLMRLRQHLGELLD